MLSTNDSLIVGSAELRANSAEILDTLKHKKVIVTQRGKPVGVMLDFAEYEKNEKYIEMVEDIVLTHIANERSKNSKPSDYLTAEQMQKLIFSQK
ncbi:MAG: hypothetical protein A2V81_03200 [Candidatus Abawacabacteria bacterium RBG_16_42_10]|uniref:Antitoxin n=1 Tax=Candidatus Abawacabacteria bacterium RBG_16_42_10 TaxID=1817814 RepID=A0A1F4XKI3_9BACT|nr:MAG: hypothetical protein A2V81_03200 [Candidatus Abawacabacteria bacterium RBG_16_42_10]